MIKTSSQLVLLSLFNPTSEGFEFYSVDIISELLSHLDYRSMGSVWNNLENKGLIVRESVSGQKMASITSYGRRQLVTLFPSFNQAWLDWEGSWKCLVFNEAPKTDQSFRYLRTLLLKKGCVQLVRGVYIYPDIFHESILNELIPKYRNAVYVFEASSFELGSIEGYLTNHFSMSDQISIYSGISKEIHILLANIDTKKTLNNGQKKDLARVLKQYHSVLSEDLGFIRYYFPKSESSETVGQAFSTIIKAL